MKTQRGIYQPASLASHIPSNALTCSSCLPRNNSNRNIYGRRYQRPANSRACPYSPVATLGRNPLFPRPLLPCLAFGHVTLKLSHGLLYMQFKTVAWIKAHACSELQCGQNQRQCRYAQRPCPRMPQFVGNWSSPVTQSLSERGL